MSQGHFVRVLNNKDVLALAFGTMIGGGWVVLAQEFKTGHSDLPEPEPGR